MRTLLACVLAVGFIAPAAAETQIPEGTILEEYVLSDQGRLVCGLHPDTVASMPELDVLEVATRRCLRMGEIYMHMTRADAEKILPPAAKDMPDADRNVVWTIYPSDPTDGSKGAYIIAYEDDIVMYIWAQGPTVIPDAHFSSIRLDAPAETIIARLGEPSARTPAPDINGEQWSYGVQSFAFEVVDGRVYSIRLVSPKLMYGE